MTNVYFGILRACELANALVECLDFCESRLECCETGNLYAFVIYMALYIMLHLIVAAWPAHLLRTIRFVRKSKLVRISSSTVPNLRVGINRNLLLWVRSFHLLVIGNFNDQLKTCSCSLTPSCEILANHAEVSRTMES